MKSTPHVNASVACVHADGTGMGRLCAYRRDGNGSASIHCRHTECLCVCVCVCVAWRRVDLVSCRCHSLGESPRRGAGFTATGKTTSNVEVDVTLATGMLQLGGCDAAATSVTVGLVLVAGVVLPDVVLVLAVVLGGVVVGLLQIGCPLRVELFIAGCHLFGCRSPQSCIAGPRPFRCGTTCSLLLVDRRDSCSTSCRG